VTRTSERERESERGREGEREGGSGKHCNRPEGGCQEEFVRFEVFTAATMKNVVFWDIKTKFVLHRRRITSPLQIPAR
jgi:hypothetical protein